jgi:hypothetical protein
MGTVLTGARTTMTADPTDRTSLLTFGLEMSPERAALPCRMKVEKTDDSYVGSTCGLRQLLQKRYVAV